MCIRENNAMVLRRDYNPDFLDLKSRLAPDIYFITREKLKIPAHKIVLAQDDFWKDLFISMNGASGICQAEAWTIFLPEIDFKTVQIMLMCYYKGSAKLKKTETDAVVEIIRSFNPKFCVASEKCRICKTDVHERKIYQHVLDHVKTSAKRDINSDALTRRCSFSESKTCTLENDRRTVTNGIFNDSNENDQEENMVEIIKEHYRRHLRDELNYLRKNFKSSIVIPTDESSYCLAEISTNNSTDENTHLTTDRLDGTPDDYSGGMSSPDHSTQGEDLNLESKSNSRRSSIEDDSNKNSEAKCNHCDQIVKIKYFRQHYIKHIYKELEQFIMREKGVDKKSSKCTMCNGKKGEKVWEMKALVKHIALVHDLLSHFLKEKGQELHEHFRFVSKSRNPSGESSEHQPDTFIAALSNKSKEIAVKNKSEIEDKNIEPDSDDSSLLCYTNNLGRQKRDGTDVDQLETQSVLSGNLEKNMSMEEDSEDEKETLPPNELQDPDKMYFEDN